MPTDFTRAVEEVERIEALIETEPDSSLLQAAMQTLNTDIATALASFKLQAAM